MPEAFLKSLEAIQPSQLYISSERLEGVNEFFDPEEHSSYDPVPIIELGGQVIYTDGHTRAFAAWSSGLEKIKVCWDTDDLNLEMYEVCVEWCKSEGISTIADLKGRVLPPEEFERLWIERCERRLEELKNSS